MYDEKEEKMISEMKNILYQIEMFYWKYKNDNSDEVKQFIHKILDIFIDL